ncbi:MAG: permease-like cell division protein FtsX [Nocardioides sp.]
MQLRHVFSELGQGLRRNLSMHVAVILTLFVSLLLVALGILLAKQTQLTAEKFGDELNVTVTLCRDNDPSPSCPYAVTDQQKKEIRRSLDEAPQVDSYEFYSQSQVWARILANNPGDLRLTGEHPILRESDVAEELWIELGDPHDVDLVAEQVAGLDGVASVAGLPDVAKTMLDALDRLKYGAVGLASFLVVAALLLVANTIRLAAFARRREIAIMRLVGASTLYIALPFLLEAVVTAVVGAGLAIGALAGFQYFVIGKGGTSVDGENWVGGSGLSGQLHFTPWVDWPEMVWAGGAIGILGLALTIVPTLLLTRKYIKV